MSKELHPENNCENCFRKKYCTKDCGTKKRYERNLINDAIAKMQGEQRLKEVLGDSMDNFSGFNTGFTSGYVDTGVVPVDVESFTTASSKPF